MIKFTKKQAAIYKQKWRNVESNQIRESQAAPMLVKFKQLCFLMNSFHSKRSDQERERQVRAIRKRWVMLKKNARP